MANTKFENLILYICAKSTDDSRLGRTKLNKLLYFADFGYYREKGHSISGEEYMAIENGPVPRQMKPTLDKLLGAEMLKEELVPTGRRPMQKPICLVEPDIADFSPDEISFIDGLLAKFQHLNGTDLANMSHAEPGYFVATYGETIHYPSAYLPPFVEISDEDKQRTEELADKYSWKERFAV